MTKTNAEIRACVEKSREIINRFVPERDPLIADTDDNVELHATLVLVFLSRSLGEPDDFALAGIKDSQPVRDAKALLARYDALEGK